MADLLVTGTDTDVGKTVVAAAIILGLRQMGIRAVGFKPAETGLAPEAPADSEVLAVASTIDVPLARPLLRRPELLCPAVAADRAGLVLAPQEIEERISALRAAGHFVVVEGTGGILAPLAWGYTVLDLASRMGLEAVVVSRAGLGALNHVSLTVEALRRRDVPIRGVVLNARGEPPDLAEATNPAALERLLPGLKIVTVPRQAPSTPLGVARGSVGAVMRLWH